MLCSGLRISTWKLTRESWRERRYYMREQWARPYNYKTITPYGWNMLISSRTSWRIIPWWEPSLNRNCPTQNCCQLIIKSISLLKTRSSKNCTKTHPEQGKSLSNSIKKSPQALSKAPLPASTSKNDRITLTEQESCTLRHLRRPWAEMMH